MFAVYINSCWNQNVSQVEGDVSWRGNAHPAAMPGTSALPLVHRRYGTQQVRGLFFPLIQEDFFVSCIYSQVCRHLGTRASAEQLLQVIKAKAEKECGKEKGF